MKAIGIAPLTQCKNGGRGQTPSGLSDEPAADNTNDASRAIGVLLSGSPRGIPRRVVMSRDSTRSERDGARNTRI